jgi:hypothetical protein
MAVRLALVTLAVALLLVPLPAPSIEHLYSQTLFPRLQSTLTSTSNLTSLAWFDLLLLVTSVVVVVLSVFDLRTLGVARACLRIVVRVATVGSLAYLVFLATWGLNYRRESLHQRLPYDAARVSADTATALARDTVARLNALYTAAHQAGWQEPLEVDRGLATAFHEAALRLGLPGDTVVGRPKNTILDLYFRRAGVAGMTDPYFLETLVASDVLPFERPSVIAHEWGHLAGLTDEGEANFLGWLTCERGTAAHQYSGSLFLYSEVVDGLPRDLARGLSAQLADGPRTDLQAIRERYFREVSPSIAQAGWQAYDRYLKANRVESGTASYAEVVRLILGTGIR